MKKILLIVLFTIASQISHSQITLDNSYANSALKLSGVVNLSNSGFKYVIIDEDANQVKLYNLDHSIFKTMSFDPSSSGGLSVWYISENTFDLDNGVEFLVAYGAYYDENAITRIYNEDGTVLFEQVGQEPNWLNPNSPHDEINALFSTTSGTKMILHSSADNSGKVYSLPGSLPLALNEIQELRNDFDIKLYPNPTKNNKISIAYTLPDNVKIGKINVYSMSGQIVKSFDVDHNFKTIELNTENLNSGTYICEVIGNFGRISTSNFIVQN